MIDRLAELSLLHHRADKYRGNLIAAGVVILVPGHDQQTVMCLRKLNVAVDVLLQPGISLCDGPIMHVVIQVRNHKGKLRQSGEIRRKTGKRLVRASGNIREIDPWTMLPGVSAGGAHCGTGGR